MAEYRDDEVLYIPEGVTEITRLREWLDKNGFQNVKKIVLPRSVQKIATNGFAKCENLEEIVLNDGLQTIEDFVFAGCHNLKQIVIPKSVEKIGDGIFKNCAHLENIVVENGANYCDMGCDCVFDKAKNALIAGCKNTRIPESTTAIGASAFAGITGLKEIHIPKTVEQIGNSAFSHCTGLCEKSVHYLTTVGRLNHQLLNGAVINFDNRELRLDDIFDYANSSNGLVLQTKDGDYYFANKLLDLTCLTKEQFDKMENLHNDLKRIRLEDIYKLYEWREYDKIPHHIVVEKMPIAEIPNFYLNNNRKNWQILIKNIRQKSDIAIDTVFTLAHALGVFSTDGKESKDATEFIVTELLSEYKIEKLHDMVSDFNRSIKYNPEFAKFFMQNFDGLNFLEYNIPETDEKVSLVSACYNNFQSIQEAYPEKKSLTRHNNERLTPELILKVLSHKKYKDVDERAKELAKTAGLYGYSQYQFDLLQAWYLRGLNNECVFNPKKDDDGAVTYEILEKSNPLGAVIGTITNCCQVAGGVGSHCVEHGMSQPNSTFVVFRNGARIIGQAWIWYDETNKQITLDNIEIPNSVLEDIYDGKVNQREFVECLERLANDLIADFGKNGRAVDDVTVGLGRNDFQDFLVNRFAEIENPHLLSGYNFYTDANRQITLLQPLKIKDDWYNQPDLQ